MHTDNNKQEPTYTQLKEERELLALANVKMRKRIVELEGALQGFITFDLSDMEFTTNEDTMELRNIYAKAKAALQGKG